MRSGITQSLFLVFFVFRITSFEEIDLRIPFKSQNMCGDAIKKPSSISLNLSLEMLGSSGARVLHIGDTLNDLHASHKVLRFNPLREENLVTVGACYGYEGREKLGAGVQTAEGAVKFDYLIDTPKELVGIVKELLSK